MNINTPRLRSANIRHLGCIWPNVQSNARVMESVLDLLDKGQEDWSLHLLVGETNQEEDRFLSADIDARQTLSCLCVNITVTFPFVLMTSTMVHCEAWGLLFLPSKTDVLVWPLMLANHAIYHQHDWESFSSKERGCRKTIPMKLELMLKKPIQQ